MDFWQNLTLENLSFEFAGEIIVEIWKAIVGYEMLYEVSSFGRIKSLPRRYRNYQRKSNKILHQAIGSHGYPMVTLVKNGKEVKRTVHSLVAEAFLPNPENKPQINHKWGIKTDNRVSELEWVTFSENSKHSYDILGNITWNKGIKVGTRILGKAVSQYSLKGTFIKSFESQIEAERQTGINSRSISAATTGLAKTAGGFIWKAKKT